MGLKENSPSFVYFAFNQFDFGYDFPCRNELNEEPIFF